MIQHILKFLRRKHADLRQSEHVYMVLVALLIGLGGGLFAVAFRKLIGLGNWIGWLESEYTLDLIHGIPFWWKIIVPSVGGLLCAVNMMIGMCDVSASLCRHRQTSKPSISGILTSRRMTSGIRCRAIVNPDCPSHA